jgi:hypothetical protein
MKIGDPPAGSSIRVTSDGDGIRLAWKKPSGGLVRYAMAGFLAFSLCMWVAVGLILIAVAVSGKMHVGASPTTQAVLLGAWALGILTDAGLLYLFIRPQRAESVSLGADSLTYDTGTAAGVVLRSGPFVVYRYAGPNPLAGLLRRRRVHRFSRPECPEFVLEGLGAEQRLRFDVGADRVVIGETLREPDREWLAQVLAAWRAA